MADGQHYYTEVSLPAMWGHAWITAHMQQSRSVDAFKVVYVTIIHVKTTLTL